MPHERSWVPAAEFSASYEAEFAAGILRDAGIPVLVRGPEIGIFGPGFAGATSRGVTLLVPPDLLDDARALLDEDEDVG